MITQLVFLRGNGRRSVELIQGSQKEVRENIAEGLSIYKIIQLPDSVKDHPGLKLCEQIDHAFEKADPVMQGFLEQLIEFVFLTAYDLGDADGADYRSYYEVFGEREVAQHEQTWEEGGEQEEEVSGPGH